MSGYSSSETCPNCGNEAGVCGDSRPFSNETVECLHCGFYTFITVAYLDLHDLNELRSERGDETEYPLLEELPEQTFEW